MNVYKSLCILGAMTASLSSVACSKDPETRMREHVARGDRYLQEKKIDEAVIEYRNAVQAVPRAGETYLKLAEAYEQTSEPFKAFPEYRRAADLLPDRVDVQLKAAGALALAGRYDDAKVHIERVLAKDPKNVDALTLLGTALAGLKQFDAAIKEIEEAIALDPADPRRQVVLASVYMSDGDAERAEAALKAASELSPNVGVLLSLGNFYWAVGRIPEAEAAFTRATQAAPANPDPHRALAGLYLTTSRPEAAEPHLRRVAELAKDFRSRFALADYLVSRNRPDDARAVLEPMLAEADAFGDAKARLATLEFSQGRIEQALISIDEVLKRDARNLRARLLKVRLLADRSRYDEASAEIAEALKLDPASAPAHYVDGVLREATGDRDAARRAYMEVLRLNPRAVQAQIRLSALNLSAGTYDLAVQYASQAVSDEPSNQDAHVALSRALLARGDTAGAQKEVEGLATRFPDSMVVQSLVGALKTQQNDVAGARIAYQKVLARNVASPEALSGLLVLDAKAKRLDDARRRIEGVAAAQPKNVAVHLIAARTYAAARDWARCEQSLRQVLALDVNQFDAYSMLGSVYYNQGRLADATREFQQLAERAGPSSPMPPTMVGALFQLQDQTADAITWYKRALQADPEAAVAANNLAWLYGEGHGDLDEALNLAKKAADRLPERPEVSDTLGWMYYRRGESGPAVDSFRRSAEKEPANPVYQYHLGAAHALAGDKAAARNALEAALRLNPAFTEAAEAKRLLAGL